VRRTQHLNLTWSSDIAYAVGLIATDGNLSNDGRHINLTSKDIDLLHSFKRCLALENMIGEKRGGYSGSTSYYVQFGSKNFYEFLLSIGLTPAKSHTMASLKIPNKYFADFLRGCIDGDGNISVQRHPESKHPQLRIRLICASYIFLRWVKDTIQREVKVQGGSIRPATRAYVLAYGKADAIKILRYMYNSKARGYLRRKYVIAEPFLT